MMNGKMIALKDHSGNTSTVTIADVNQSNGVITSLIPFCSLDNPSLGTRPVFSGP
jgi:hypothetical protein